MMLKSLAKEFTKPLTILFKKSIDLSKLPYCWKTSNISVIFKKGMKYLAGNYRPISLTSVLCKILESIIREHLVDHMLINGLFTEKQYGFISGRSAALQLLRVLDEWSEALDNGDAIDAIYMDFQKAFDTVPHRRLLRKVKAYGFVTNIVDWLADFLTGRTQVVNIKGESSEAKHIKSGIPQGSVLGPFLFLLFVNDIPELVKSMLYLFADDNKIWRVIANRKDKELLQTYLETVFNWSKVWLMRIHPDKSAHLRIGQQMDVPQYEYTVGVKHVHYKTQEKDLGVLIDNSLSFNAHICEKVKKANMMAGWVRRSFQFLNTDVFNLLYKSLVRSHLEYAISVWSPHLAKHIDQIEEVQMRATKMVPKLKNMPYPDRLRSLRLPTLSYRRIRGDMINTYKMLSGIYHKECCPKMTTMLDKTGRQGRHSKYLFQERSKLDLRKYSFTQRVVNIWNSLPEEVVSATTVDRFKGALDKHWNDKPIKYHYKEHPKGISVTRK